MVEEIKTDVLIEKQKYLSIIHHVADLEDLRFGDGELAYLPEHYDPMAFALRIVETIIDHTQIIKSSKIEGITRDFLFSQLKPYFDKVDAETGKDVPVRHREAFIDRILSKLTTKDGRRFEMTFSDLEKPPHCKQKQPFSLVVRDDKEIKLDYRLINIFTRIHDVKIEHEQIANDAILRKQIEKGQLNEALETARANYTLTKMTVAEIIEIINETRRKYISESWLTTNKNKLREAMDNIDRIITYSKFQLNLLVMQRDKLVTADYNAFHLIKKIETTIDEAMALALPLQGKIREARKTFFDEQLRQAFMRKVVDMPSFESDVFPWIMTADLQDTGFMFDMMIPFFSQNNMPKILTLDNLFMLLSKDFKRRGPDRVQPVVIPEDRKQFGREHEIFPVESRIKVIERIKDIVERGPTTLQDVLTCLLANGFSIDDANYARILLQGRAAEDKFESKFMKFNINARARDEYLNMKVFVGNDYTIDKRKRIKMIKT
nr:hypothetical protein [Candidatus Sigynarchaeota archaeon]